jgi:hypothetical protein
MLLNKRIKEARCATMRVEFVTLVLEVEFRVLRSAVTVGDSICARSFLVLNLTCPFGQHVKPQPYSSIFMLNKKPETKITELPSTSNIKQVHDKNQI